MNLYQKLAKIRKIAEAIQKDKKSFNYKYVSEDAVLAKVTAGMEKYNVSLIPSIVHETVNVQPYNYEKTTVTKASPPQVILEKVNEVLVSAEMTYTWINNDDPTEKIVVNWFMVGQQNDASKSFGSGLSYANRYFLLKYFQVATPEDDVDAWKQKQSQASNEDDKLIIKTLIAQIDAHTQKFVAENPDKKDQILDTIGSINIISGKKEKNYLKIQSVEIATEVLSTIKENFKLEDK